MKKTIKVLLINNAYPTEDYPKRGGYIKSIEECLLEANLCVDRLVLNTNYKGKIQKLLYYKKFYTRLLLFKDYSEYDYIYIHHFPYVFAALILGFKKMKSVVINFHGEDVVYTSLFSRLFNKVSYKFLSSKFTYVFPSDFFKEKAIKSIPKLKGFKLVVSPSGGVDTEVFKPITSPSGNLSKTRVGFASGMDYNKGIEDLIFLLNEFKSSSYEFHVINYGKQRNKYINTISSFKNVILYDVFKKVDMPIFYSKIDVLFFPSKSESLGLVALEAMSCNVPVIGPDDFALSTIIINGVTGEKYDPLKEMNYLDAFESFKNNRMLYHPKPLVEKNYSKNSVVKQFKLIFK